jgi:hypothetical protein
VSGVQFSVTGEKKFAKQKFSRPREKPHAISRAKKT